MYPAWAPLPQPPWLADPIRKVTGRAVSAPDQLQIGCALCLGDKHALLHAMLTYWTLLVSSGICSGSNRLGPSVSPAHLCMRLKSFAGCRSLGSGLQGHGPKRHEQLCTLRSSSHCQLAFSMLIAAKTRGLHLVLQKGGW